MEQVICKGCGSIDRYTASLKSNNLVAYCDDCGMFIKNIPQGKPQEFHFGKYKGILVKECNDLPYMKWVQVNVKVTAALRTALTDRILSLENMLR